MSEFSLYSTHTVHVISSPYIGVSVYIVEITVGAFNIPECECELWLPLLHHLPNMDPEEDSMSERCHDVSVNREQTVLLWLRSPPMLDGQLAKCCLSCLNAGLSSKVISVLSHE